MDIFRNLTDEQKELIRKDMRTEIYNPGHLILKETDPAYGFYLVVRGDVEILRGEISDKDSRVSVVREGEVFGTIGLLFNKRVFSARTLTKCTVMVFPNNPIKLFESFKDREAAMIFLVNLILIVSERVRNKYLQGNQTPMGIREFLGYGIKEEDALKTIEKNLPKNTFRCLLNNCSLKEGDTLFEQGKKAGSFYYIHSGSLEVFHEEDEDVLETRLFRVEAPYVVGELAFFTKQPYQVTCRATSDVRYTQFDGKDFNKMLKNEPKKAFQILFASAQLICLLLLK